MDNIILFLVGIGFGVGICIFSYLIGFFYEKGKIKAEEPARSPIQVVTKRSN